MPDSLSHQLAIVASKADETLQQLSKLSNKSTLSAWAPPIIASLIAAIIGTLLAQAIDRRYKGKSDKEKDLREIHSKAVNLKIRLKDLFRRLAMFKFHAQYWWHIHFKAGEGELKDKYYLEHLRSQAEARDTEKEIGEVIADFLSEVVRFERLKGKSFNVDQEKQLIENLTFPKAKTYADDLDPDVLRETLAEGDEKELRDSYWSKLQVFQSIITKMC